MENFECVQVDSLMKEGAEEYRFVLPQVTDVSRQEGIRLELELCEEELTELEVILYPLYIARPEFFPCVKGRIAVAGKGLHRVEIPFEQFGFRQMVRAFLNYLDAVSVRVVKGSSVRLKSIQADSIGDFAVRIQCCSIAKGTGEWAVYAILLENKIDKMRVVNVHRSEYGKECLPAEYEPYVVLKPHESREYSVQIRMTEDIPAGGWEKNTFLFVPDGDGAQEKSVTVYTSKERPHPYLFLTAEQWKRRREALDSNKSLWDVFFREYVTEAERWKVPEVSKDADVVYPIGSQNPLFRTAVAWKITGRKEYLQKALRFLEGLLDEKDGYLTTEKSYFEFIESRAEYHRGDFKVRRAQSGGWVQEAEFFNKTAMSYDLLYDYFTPEQRLRMEKCLRNYMDFAAWRLTDGDGNNFQLAESAAGALCAMVLQDQGMLERFLYGFNGYTDLLSAVLLDDGMYFEEASGYVRLAGELCFDLVNAAENYGIALKDSKVPASYDRNIMHSPWAMRETWADDGKPFLGMSFQRFERFTRTTRSLKDYFDCTAKLLTDKGIMFSINDSNEQDFSKLYQKAYYLYKEPLYKEIADLADMPEALLVSEPEDAYGLSRESVLLPGAGLGILRDGTTQAVLKFGVHGGYHGHYDRLSLTSFLKDNQTFHNNEYAWYGYDSFLFKMWVQASVAHNMTVVDGRMQKPSPCQCVYYEPEGQVRIAPGSEVRAGEGKFRAICAQTITEWMDPPYGGQTPYPQSFPEEKCAQEGRFILKAHKKRNQGEIGDYSEPIFQKRLLILFHGYCIVWDYLEGDAEHRYDCLYHPMGRYINEDGFEFVDCGRFTEDPYGAGQFILNCRKVQVQGSIALRFHEAKARNNGNDIIDNVPESVIWRAYPQCGEILIGKYPQKGDTFTEENIQNVKGYFEEPQKKTVSFIEQGKKASFITLLEAGQTTGQIKNICCESFDAITVEEADGSIWMVAVDGMSAKDGEVSVVIEAVQ